MKLLKQLMEMAKVSSGKSVRAKKRKARKKVKDLEMPQRRNPVASGAQVSGAGQHPSKKGKGSYNRKHNMVVDS